jgi:hypothetical protein
MQRTAFLGIIGIFWLAFLPVGFTTAAVTPAPPGESEVLPHPDPAVFTWNSAIAYYDNHLIYAGDDKKIYGVPLDGKTSTVICDTSGLSDPWAAVSGFLVAADNHLYFHENRFPAVKVYRLLLTDPWPAAYEELDTGCEGSIFAFTENPWTQGVWFASADLATGAMHLYEVESDFARAVERASFPAPNGGGSGPIVFKGPDTLLYGEFVYLGDPWGAFHLMDTTTGAVIMADYLTFEGGLAGTAYGYNNLIYAATGEGKSLCEVMGHSKDAVAVADDDIQSLAFDGTSLYVSTQVPFTPPEGGPDDGTITFHRVWNLEKDRQVIPGNSYHSRTLGEPDPEAFPWNSALAYFDKELMYAGNDQKIHGYNLVTGDYREVLDLSGNPDFGFGPSGFLVGLDGRLYFHDNGSSDKIYRIDLTVSEPVVESFSTGAHGNIFAFAYNPWTEVVWFASSDFPPGDMYLYEVDGAFQNAYERARFPQPHGGGSGPIVFAGPASLLYGEVYVDPETFVSGPAYFHLVDTVAGHIDGEDYLVFDGGLAGASYAYDDHIFVTTGAGRRVYEISGRAKTEVATTMDDAQGIVFDGSSLYISSQSPTEGSIRGHGLWRLIPTGVPEGQEAPVDSVGGDLAVRALGVAGEKAVGVSGGDTHTFVSYLEAISPLDIDDGANRPDRLPFGLVRFRLKRTSEEDTGTAVVHLSVAAPKGSKWYIYDAVEGWQDYSQHAAFSPDRGSVTLEFKDGGYGDADRIVNGYILDTGGVGVGAPAESGGGGGGCFIHTAGSEGLDKGWGISAVILVWGLFVRCSLTAMRKYSWVQRHV